MHQIMFVAHDLGHKSGSSHRALDRYVGATIAAWASGISIGWWIDQHDVHHRQSSSLYPWIRSFLRILRFVADFVALAVVTNHPEHDPDIQLLPTFAFTPRFFTNVYSTFHSAVLEFDPAAQFFVKYQHLFFYPIMVVARFSLFGKSYHYVRCRIFSNRLCLTEIAAVVDEGQARLVQDVRDGRSRLLLDLLHDSPQIYDDRQSRRLDLVHTIHVLPHRSHDGLSYPHPSTSFTLSSSP